MAEDYFPSDKGIVPTADPNYTSQKAKIAMASAGSPTDCKTSTIVTIPALGIPGAPIEAIIAIIKTIHCWPK